MKLPTDAHTLGWIAIGAILLCFPLLFCGCFLITFVAVVADMIGGPYYEVITIARDGYPIAYKTEFYIRNGDGDSISFDDSDGQSHTISPPYQINRINRPESK